MLTPALLLYGSVVALLLLTELKEHVLGQITFKSLAALGFILIALHQGALETDYGVLILTGLLACAIGDICLLSRKSNALFKAGMAAFALGHIFYIFATTYIGRLDVSFIFWASTYFIGCAIGVIIFLRLREALPQAMIWPVGIYIFIITFMCVQSAQVEWVNWYGLAFPAALLFAVSDLFVARDRFIKPNPKNAFLITPLYFGAQALFALSVTV